MATYVIGDIQGCFDSLRHLLDKFAYAPETDQLWFAGDLVNRGPASLEVLRFVRSLGNSAVVVLGNHDLHLLAVAAGARVSRHDTLDAVLNADDRDELLDWLRQQPLLHEANDGSIAMLHAGLAPQWTLTQARACAREVESALRQSNWRELLGDMYGDQPDLWNDQLTGMERLRFIINCYTRLRYCDVHGRLQLRDKGTPGSQSPQLLPWFAVPTRATRDVELIFGHWSTLGQVHWPEHRVYGIDTGCLWGGSLTALRLDDRRLFSLGCPPYQKPGAGGD